MILDMIRGDIFECGQTQIAFPVNAEGHYDAGIAGAMASRWWPELIQMGPMPLGTFQAHTVDARTLFACSVHSLADHGWALTPAYVERSFNALPVEGIVATVLIGGGPIATMSGADLFLILGALARCRKQVVVYMLD